MLTRQKMHCNTHNPTKYRNVQVAQTSTKLLKNNKINYVIFLYLRHISVLFVLYLQHISVLEMHVFFICLSCEHLQSLCCKIDEDVFACVLSFAAG